MERALRCATDNPSRSPRLFKRAIANYVNFDYVPATQRYDKAERALFRSQFNELAKLFCHLSARVVFAFAFRAIAKIFHIIIDEIKHTRIQYGSYHESTVQQSYDDFFFLSLWDMRPRIELSTLYRMEQNNFAASWNISVFLEI